MPKGMRIPIKVGPHGGADVFEGPDVIAQNIAVGLTPAGSLHPFHQNIAPDEDLIYEIRDEKSGGLFTIHAKQLFEELERIGHARLFPGGRGLTIRPSGPGEEGDMIVEVRYINLEMNTAQKIDIPMKSAERR